MASFDFQFPEGSLLYRGSAVKEDLTDEQHKWFAETRDIAKGYGDIVTKYTTTRALKLINISSPLFHFDYIGKVNLHFRHHATDDMNKALALMPLGLPTLEEARRTLSRIPIPNEFLNFRDTEQTLNMSSYTYNAQRMSLRMGDIILDDCFVNLIKKIYPSFDGYIQPIMTGTGLFGGKRNHPEICIFAPGSSVIQKQAQGGKGQKGGMSQSNKSKPINVIHIPGWSYEKMIEEDNERRKKEPQLEFLPPINMMYS